MSHASPSSAARTTTVVTVDPSTRAVLVASLGSSRLRVAGVDRKTSEAVGNRTHHARLVNRRGVARKASGASADCVRKFSTL